MERSPAWSPDGKTLAYFSDESGEYGLHLRSAEGRGTVEKIDFGTPPSFYYSPSWSPDGTKIAYADKRRNVWYVDLRTKTPVKVDTNVPLSDLSPAWSPDSQWLAYAKRLKNGFGVIFLYSLPTRQRVQITDGLHDAACPAFAPDGKRLYFTASTDTTRPGTRNVYVIALQKDAPALLPAAKGDEDARPQNDAQNPIRPEVSSIQIDLEDIGHRMQAVPTPADNYVGLIAADDEALFLLESKSALRRGIGHARRPERSVYGDVRKPHGLACRHPRRRYTEYSDDPGRIARRGLCSRKTGATVSRESTPPIPGTPA